MPDATEGTNDQTPQEPQSTAALSPSAKATRTSPVREQNRLSAFLKWSKPYREITAILVAVVVAISGSVSFVVAHFATQAELLRLECRVTQNLMIQLLPIHTEDFAGKIDWRTAQIKVLAEHGGGALQSVKTIIDLTNQVSELTREQQDMIKEFQKNIDKIIANCNSVSPAKGKAQ